MTIASESSVVRSLRWGVVFAAFACGVPAFAARTRENAVQGDVRAFYQRIGDQPVWVNRDGRPTDLAWQALGRLRAVADDGLVDDDYQAASLELEASALDVTASPAAASAFDVRVTTSVLKYFRELHLGRVEPRALGFHLDHPVDAHDFPARLQSAIAARSLTAAIDGLRPPFTQYRRLREVLPAYRHGDAAKARQIELAMERLRWLPDLGGEPLIVVNIPMFHVWGWEAERSDGRPALDMAAIIGRAGATKTPIFASRLTAVVFNPEWNVPDSIARDEILPALDRDPQYLVRNHMTMGRDGSRVRIRQLPGPWNALGQIKFMLPNPHGVYLHGTPEPELFAKARRDFSHGCIRLEHPLALAEWVLGGEPEWTGRRIEEVIAEGSTRVVPVTRQPHIVVFYMTAAFMPEQGDVRFVDDIYGHDARLEAWLDARTGAPK
jgi:murein L,D-transpeptidase YcbB/YkuD